MSLMQRLATLRTIATIAVVVTCILLGMCTVRREPAVVPPPVQIEPVVVPALPPPPAPVIPPSAPDVAPDPVPVPVVLDVPEPAPVAVEAESPPPPPVPAPPAEPIAAPVAVPPAAPVDDQAARRSAIRKRLVLDGYRYGGKAPGAWPPELLEAEIERRLRAGE
jgi:hypothetical protein